MDKNILESLELRLSSVSITEDGNAADGSSSSLPTLSLFCSQESSWIQKEFAASLTNSAKEENLFLQKLIRNITEVSTVMVQGPHPCKFAFEVLDEVS